MWIIGGTYLFISLAMYFFMVPEPEEVGIKMEREDVEFAGDAGEIVSQSNSYHQQPRNQSLQ